MGCHKLEGNEKLTHVLAGLYIRPSSFISFHGNGREIPPGYLFKENIIIIMAV